jgi:hypothetical protein
MPDRILKEEENGLCTNERGETVGFAHRGSGHAFPVTILKPRARTARDFTRPQPPHDYRFSLDPAETSASLRALADDIDSKKVLLQKAACSSTAVHDDYALSAIDINVTYAETEDEPS